MSSTVLVYSVWSVTLRHFFGKTLSYFISDGFDKKKKNL